MENERVITLADAKKIGDFHNNYLARIVKEFPKDEQNLKRTFLTFAPEELTEEIKDDIFTYFETNSIEKQDEIILNAINSQEAKEIYKKVKEIII